MFIPASDIYVPKILRHGADSFTFPTKEGVLRIFISIQNPYPRPGLNTRTLGTMVSTLSITTQRRLLKYNKTM
jgi:hypothetical protein